MSYHGSQWCICVSWLSHTSINTIFLSKATEYFSHMLLQRWEAKINRKEKSPQLGIELTTTRSWVWRAHHWATRVGRENWRGAIILATFPNKPLYLHVCSTSLLKTLWEKEKLLVTSNFSFSHSVFYPFREKFFYFHQILKLSSANSLSLEGSKICLSGKS